MEAMNDKSFGEAESSDRCRGITGQQNNVLLAVRRSQSRKSHARYLRQHGFHVETADSGIACLNVVEWFRPDVVVIEPELLWGGGDGVLAVFSSQPDLCRIPALVLTTQFTRASIYSISQFAVCDFWVQPISSEKLTARIEYLLTEKRTSVAIRRADAPERDLTDRSGTLSGAHREFQLDGRHVW